MPKTTYSIRSPESWQQIMNDFDQSGQSQKTFCQRQGIALGTFSKWRSKLSVDKPEARHKAEPPLFVQLPVASGRSAEGRAWDIKLDLGSGVVLRLRSA